MFTSNPRPGVSKFAVLDGFYPLNVLLRSSRKHFTPREHWLMTSAIEVQPFVQAAILEEQQMSESREDREEPSPHPFRPSLKPSGLLSKRQAAYFSPRLAVLNNIPFAIPFETRVSIFRHFLLNDKVSRGRLDRFSSRGTKAVIRRDKIAQDGFDRLQDVNLKQPLGIVFIDHFGQEEYVCFGVYLSLGWTDNPDSRAGIDGGGVFKEFLTSLTKEVFDTNRGLWLSTNRHELYPNPHKYATDGTMGSYLSVILSLINHHQPTALLGTSSWVESWEKPCTRVSSSTLHLLDSSSRR